MALRFQKRVKIAPGVRVNLGKSGASVTTGIKGLSVNTGKKGTYLNTGIPGTGLSQRTKLSAAKPAREVTAPPKPAPRRGFGVQHAVIIGFIVLFVAGAILSS